MEGKLHHTNLWEPKSRNDWASHELNKDKVNALHDNMSESDFDDNSEISEREVKAQRRTSGVLGLSLDDDVLSCISGSSSSAGSSASGRSRRSAGVTANILARSRAKKALEQGKLPSTRFLSGITSLDEINSRHHNKPNIDTPQDDKSKGSKGKQLLRSGMEDSLQKPVRPSVLDMFKRTARKDTTFMKGNLTMEEYLPMVMPMAVFATNVSDLSYNTTICMETPLKPLVDLIRPYIKKAVRDTIRPALSVCPLIGRSMFLSMIRAEQSMSVAAVSCLKEAEAILHLQHVYISLENHEGTTGKYWTLNAWPADNDLEILNKFLSKFSLGKLYMDTLLRFPIVPEGHIDPLKIKGKVLDQISPIIVKLSVNIPEEQHEFRRCWPSQHYKAGQDDAYDLQFSDKESNLHDVLSPFSSGSSLGPSRVSKSSGSSLGRKRRQNQVKLPPRPLHLI